LFLDDGDVDLVVSLNLLSQLPVIPADFLQKIGVHSSESIATFARHLVSAHLAYLQRFPCPVALITDVEKLTLNRSGKLVETSSLLREVPLPFEGESWTWHLAPRPEADPEDSYSRRVIGIADLCEARAPSYTGLRQSPRRKPESFGGA
jgi:hypothetical protein